MTNSIAFKAMKAALTTMDKAELKECVELAQKVLGEVGVVSGTSARGKKSPLYMKVVEGVDPTIHNGYSITGPFVNRGNMAAKAGGKHIIAVARGAGKEQLIMVGVYNGGMATNFKYPSGKDGVLTDIEVLYKTDNWGDAHAFLMGKSVPNVKATVAKPEDDDGEIELK